MSLKQRALDAQLQVIREHIEEKVGSGSTYIKLFDWHHGDGGGGFSIFKFRVTREHLETLQDEMGFTIKEHREVDIDGMLWWKTERVSIWYSVRL